MSTAHPVEEGTSTAGCDEFTAVPFSHLRLVDDSGSEAGSERDQGTSRDDGGKQGSPLDETLVDPDDDDEETIEIAETVQQIREEQSKRRADNTEDDTRKGDPKDAVEAYTQTARSSLDQLPSGDVVTRRVEEEVLQKCSEDVEFVFPLAKKLSDIDSLASTILFLWVYFVGKLRDGIGKPPNSSRAAAFTIERREARQDQMQKFLRDDKIYDAALEEVGEPQALRYLGIVFNLVEEATYCFLGEKIASVNLVRVQYPAEQVQLDPDRGQVLYFLAGWLLSSALSHVKRHKAVGITFCPFVNSHKHAGAADFVRAHPELAGLESEVHRRNVPFRGLSLLFADAAFYNFVLTLETGYYDALKKPVLLATYLGDLPTKILEIVSSAKAVKEAFRLCVVSVVTGAGKGLSGYDELFNFFMMKWHNMRMADFTRSLSRLQIVLKKEKKDNRALRDRLRPADKGALRNRVRNSMNRSSGSRTVPAPTSPQRAKRAEIADKIGSWEFGKLQKKDLVEHIVSCGGVATVKENRLTLRSMLKAIAPGIGDDVHEAFLGEAKEGEVLGIALQAYMSAKQSQN